MIDLTMNMTPGFNNPSQQYCKEMRASMKREGDNSFKTRLAAILKEVDSNPHTAYYIGFPNTYMGRKLREMRPDIAFIELSFKGLDRYTL